MARATTSRQARGKQQDHADNTGSPGDAPQSGSSPTSREDGTSGILLLDYAKLHDRRKLPNPRSLSHPATVRRLAARPPYSAKRAFRSLAPRPPSWHRPGSARTVPWVTWLSHATGPGRPLRVNGTSVRSFRVKDTFTRNGRSAARGAKGVMVMKRAAAGRGLAGLCHDGDWPRWCRLAGLALLTSPRPASGRPGRPPTRWRRPDRRAATPSPPAPTLPLRLGGAARPDRRR